MWRDVLLLFHFFYGINKIIRMARTKKISQKIKDGEYIYILIKISTRRITCRQIIHIISHNSNYFSNHFPTLLPNGTLR